MSRLSYIERRSLALRFAADLGGWDCVRLPLPDRHIGRVLMIGKRIGPRFYRSGTYPAGTPDCAALDHFLGAKQRRATKELPK